MTRNLNIIYEDNDILVCLKPAGVAAGSEKAGAMDMLSMVLNYLARKERGKVPTAFLVHRLDKPVAGVMIFAKTKKAAADLSAQFAKHLCGKHYYCVVTGARESAGTLTSYIKEDKKNNVSYLCAEDDKEAKKSGLIFKELEKKEIEGRMCSLMDIELLSGRHHQIRLQMTEISEGIWGDTKYNETFKDQAGWSDLALFSYELTIKHPTSGKSMTFNELPRGELFGEFKSIL